MGQPFLEARESRERHEAIASETEAYYAAKDGESIPGREDAGDIMPESLYWLLYTEKWGLPYSGGWVEQPHHFWLDLEAADTGRQRHWAAKAASARMRAEREAAAT